MSGKSEESTGIFYAASAYGLWGVLPLYWHLLGDVPPLELSFHRMVWCALFGVIVCAAMGRLPIILSVFKTRKVILALTVSSILIAINWTVYIYAVASHELVEASLGYYINPLLSIALGVVLLGEKLSAMRIAAIALATLAVAFKAAGLGHFPWIALTLAVSFGFYGYVRKQTPIAAFDGLTVETLILFPVTAGALLFWGAQGTGAFTSTHITRDALLLFGGPLTALPLTLFAAGARRVRLSTLGFLQYLSPSITLAIAVLVLGERFTVTDAATFGCVWLALVLVALDGRVSFRKKARAE
ncbi:chloramphenicol-sensitive protein RarD [Rhizomicrobium palustre]|uniref:Chloramphenicol-sensitive protein RarD n=1 Tax=Rhizomicrobium palustre TaxID=189966 RepID=A0A846MVM6_9PROT|nr:EamA family transporter RarD [Rhizomicrobium palustre]NIK87211.1 chloramphenicol-sensitive protein RarD [Rhizomicrobium palustre]